MDDEEYVAMVNYDISSKRQLHEQDYYKRRLDTTVTMQKMITLKSKRSLAVCQEFAYLWKKDLQLVGSLQKF